MAKKRKHTTAKKPGKKRAVRKTARSKARRPRRAAKPKRRGRTKARPRPAKRTRKPAGAKKRRVTTARRAAGTRRPARAVPRRAAPPVRAAAAPVIDDLRARVVAQLTMRGYDADRPALADVLTAVATGYGKGPASAPAWLRFDVNKALAEGIVERYETGDRSPGPDRAIHRAQVRSMVDANLSLLGLADGTTDDERDVLTTICLGSWEPGMMTHAERDGIPSFVVPWYRDGR